VAKPVVRWLVCIAVKTHAQAGADELLQERQRTLAPLRSHLMSITDRGRLTWDAILDEE
jgi:hypothetical protein